MEVRGYILRLLRLFDIRLWRRCKSFSQLEMLFNLFWIELGIFLVIDGGWFDPKLTYLMVLFGFLYGLWEPSKDKVTSLKLSSGPSARY